jgi:ABC-type multidrug transport system fused ATPase/permease subunit
MGFMEVVGVGSITPFMSIISDPEIIETNRYLNWAFELFRFETHMDFIFAFGLAVIIFLAINNAARAGISFIIRYYSGKRLHSVSMRLMERYLRQPYIYFLNVNTSDISKNILSEVSTFINKVLIISLQLVTNAIVALAIIALLVAINPLIALAISLILTAAYVLIFTFIRKYLSRMGDERARVNSLKYKFVSEAFGGIKDVKLLGREGVFLGLFAKPSLKFAMNDAVSEVVGESPKFIMETLAFGGILGLILIMLGTGDQVEDFLPLITVYAFGGYRLLPALQKVFSAITKIRYNLPIVEILHHDYYSLPETGEKPESQRRPEALSFTRTIELENIRFRYPNTEEDVIKNQSLSIRANTSVGFVGPTGCGKTTTIDIILGLLEAQSGSLRVDSREITAKTRSNWQANLGYVPQSIFLVDDSIRKNIAFGIAENEIDEESVIKAAQVANLHDFIMNDLDRGYETMVGERGVRLSGGQKQRIGIARAVYHDPSVLILDEATSALDGLTENAIMDAIHNLSHKKTILMIAHRLTTVRECDEIFIMEKGVIVDRGTYDELIQRNESFRKMAEGSK